MNGLARGRPKREAIPLRPRAATRTSCNANRIRPNLAATRAKCPGRGVPQAMNTLHIFLAVATSAAAKERDCNGGMLRASGSAAPARYRVADDREHGRSGAVIPRMRYEIARVVGTSLITSTKSLLSIGAESRSTAMGR